MAGYELARIAAQYRDRFGEDALSKHRLRQWAWQRSHEGEATLLDAAASASSLGLHLRPEQLTPQMREAFSLWHRGSVEEAIKKINDAPENVRRGFRNAWIGKLFEVHIRDKLNAGKRVGGMALQKGQIAVLHANPSHPGSDFMILNSDGTVAKEIQIKMASALGPIKKALEQGVPVITSREIAREALEKGIEVIDSGVNSEKFSRKLGSFDNLLDSRPMRLAKRIAPFSPLVLIVMTEGGMVLMGRQTFRDALEHGLSRGIRLGASLGVGKIVASLRVGGGPLPIFAPIAIEMGIDRFAVHRSLIRRLRADIETLGSLPVRHP